MENEYMKRGYLLPEGCKDLIDVLQRRDRRKIDDLVAAHEASLVMRSGAVPDKLSEIERYVKMVFESHGLMFTLSISPPDELLTVDVGQTSGTIWATVVVQKGTGREANVKAFFARHGLSIPTYSATPVQFYPHLPVYCDYCISPMPPDTAGLALLLANCFRQLCGLTDDSELNFRYCEIAKAI